MQKRNNRDNFSSSSFSGESYFKQAENISILPALQEMPVDLSVQKDKVEDNMLVNKNALNYKKLKLNLYQIHNKAMLRHSNQPNSPGYNDPSFEYFLNNRVYSNDYQSYYYKNNLMVILVNIYRAVQNEAKNFLNYLHNAIENGYQKIVIDMTAIDFMDSTFVGVLISTNRRYLINGGKIKLVLRNNLEFTNPLIRQSLEKNFDIYLDLKIAIRS
ncbi:MAG: STAS domain-containing protein [Ignavibacteriaceae bacterium]